MANEHKTVSEHSSPATKLIAELTDRAWCDVASCIGAMYPGLLQSARRGSEGALAELGSRLRVMRFADWQKLVMAAAFEFETDAEREARRGPAPPSPEARGNGPDENHTCYDRETCHSGCGAYAIWKARLVASGGTNGRRPGPIAVHPAASGAEREAMKKALEAVLNREAMVGHGAFKFAVPRAPEASCVSVPCARPGCGHVTVYPTGMMDLAEGRCAHVFDFDPMRSVRGAMVCRGCGIAVDVNALVDSTELDRRLNGRANGLADKAQALADENKDLLVENARLRRSLEKAGRK
jgi:hypothetical protein